MHHRPPGVALALVALAIGLVAVPLAAADGKGETLYLGAGGAIEAD